MQTSLQSTMEGGVRSTVLFGSPPALSTHAVGLVAGFLTKLGAGSRFAEKLDDLAPVFFRVKSLFLFLNVLL